MRSVRQRAAASRAAPRVPAPWCSPREALKGRGGTSPAEEPLKPALCALDRSVDRIDRSAERGGARRALLGRRALDERKLDRAGTAAVAAKRAPRVDPHVLDTLGFRKSERLRPER